MEEQKRLYRSRTDKVIAGVCGGLGDYFGIDPVILRVLWAVLVFVFGTGILAYLIAWLVMPAPPEIAPLEVNDE